MVTDKSIWWPNGNFVAFQNCRFVVYSFIRSFVLSFIPSFVLERWNTGIKVCIQFIIYASIFKYSSFIKYAIKTKTHSRTSNASGAGRSTPCAPEGLSSRGLWATSRIARPCVTSWPIVSPTRGTPAPTKLLTTAGSPWPTTFRSHNSRAPIESAKTFTNGAARIWHVSSTRKWFWLQLCFCVFYLVEKNNNIIITSQVKITASDWFRSDHLVCDIF